MPIVACPNCLNKLRVEDAGPRRQVRCPACQAVFLASAAERVDKGAGPSRRAPIDVPTAKAVPPTDPEPDDAGPEVVEEPEPPKPRRRAEEPADVEPEEPAAAEEPAGPPRSWFGLGVALGALVPVALAVLLWLWLRG
jgi:hypothetical protein